MTPALEDDKTCGLIVPKSDSKSPWLSMSMFCRAPACCIYCRASSSVDAPGAPHEGKPETGGDSEGNIMLDSTSVAELGALNSKSVLVVKLCGESVTALPGTWLPKAAFR